MNHEEIAVSKRNQGYNCAQAVLCAYAKELNMDEKQLFVLSEAFGSGLGCTLGTCGALNAAAMVQSVLTSTGNLDHPDSKAITYPKVRNILKAFENEVGALRCRDIKGIETGKVLCECEDCVRIACRLIDDMVEFKDEESFL